MGARALRLVGTRRADEAGRRCGGAGLASRCMAAGRAKQAKRWSDAVQARQEAAARRYGANEPMHVGMARRPSPGGALRGLVERRRQTGAPRLTVASVLISINFR
ncbi:hypothetical protein IDH44_02270 [Paenibacillus sp. IB182496]|uniref:Uncharacterized protein n=1 Tax=Paenibacillus sabuli TaxID=2772509 RepID=A0A927GQ00_9BACL|nr:hypothetical protein [Paenibacillus sabuli]MBD2844004.1 hypothetical protein [Paenibacillus sabuli]